MTPQSPDEQVISYSVRDLFERVDSRLVGIDNKLDSKADRADLDALRAEVASMRLWQAKVIGAAAAVSLIGGSGAAALLRALAG